MLLPGAFYFLRETQLPPMEALRKHGVKIAIASDLNPGTSPALSLRLMLNMACTCFRMTPEEALAGATIHAAHGVGHGRYPRFAGGRQGRGFRRLANRSSGGSVRTGWAVTWKNASCVTASKQVCRRAVVDKVLNFKQGRVPLLISMPHAGVRLTPAVEAGLIPAAKSLPDTDWHIPQLYDFAAELGASTSGRRILAVCHRPEPAVRRQAFVRRRHHRPVPGDTVRRYLVVP